MTRCATYRDRAGAVIAIACGPPARRICDVCDRTASGPPDTLRDGTRYDGCTRCRGRIAIARKRRESGLPANDREWLLEAERRIRESLAGVRG